MRIDDVVVISLPERRDRLSAFFAGLPEGWPFPRPRVVAGVVATPPPYWRVSAGAYGCCLAHVQVLTEAFTAGKRNLLVLEDDAVFTPDFVYLWKEFSRSLPKEWSMLMLGGEHKIEPVDAGRFHRCVDTRRTHAYVVRDRAMPFLARTWSQASTHIDHLLPDLQQQMPVFAPKQWLVGQRAGTSDISPTVSTVNRFWSDEKRPAGPRP
jgi:hypothetical protein